MQFLNIFKFELLFQSKKLSMYVYAFLFFLAGFLISGAMGGAFTGATVMIGGAGETVFMNSPYIIFQTVLIMNIFSLILIAILSAGSIIRDYDANTFAFFYTKPINKFSFILGRLLANIIVILVVNLFLSLGLYLGTFLPGYNQALLGPFNFFAYIHPYLIMILPNAFICGAIFVTIAVHFRKMLWVYISAIIMFTVYTIGMSFLSRLELKELATFLDPFGLNSVVYVTEKWSSYEMNNNFIPFSGKLLYNRLLWIGISAIILIIGIIKFRFSYHATKIKLPKLLQTKQNKAIEKLTQPTIQKPQVTKKFNLQSQLSQLWSFIKIETKSMILHPVFIVISIIGLLIAFTAIQNSGRIFETSILPLTHRIASVAMAAVSTISFLLITIFSGELIWRDRTNETDQILDSSPMKNINFLLPKFIAILTMLFSFYIVIGLMGILYQLSQGFFDIDFLLYGKFWLINFLRLFVLIALAFFIQIISNQKYTAHFIFLAIVISPAFIPYIGLEHPLFKFNYAPGINYSEMNGFGNFIQEYIWYRIYWISISLLMIIISYLFIIRGKETSFANRISTFKKRLNKFHKTSIIFTSIIILGSGGYIYYNVNILNEFITSKEQIKNQIEYEKKLKKYESLPMPKITDVFLEVDLYPDHKKGHYKGRLTLKNKNSVPIKEIHLNLNKDIDYSLLSFSKPYKLTKEYNKFAYKIFTFNQEIQPGDTLTFTFEGKSQTKGFYGNPSICPNGTFVNNTFFTPAFGYDPQGELASKAKRQKYNLPPKKRMPSLEDDNALQNNMMGDDADWVNFEAIVSTKKGQTAITPGYLQKQWDEKNRSYFHYKMDHPILNFFAFVSGDYQVKKDIWKDENGKKVNLEIYHYYKHTTNLDRMMNALKDGLSYYSKNYTPYPDSQVRIIEFPAYATFAQSFPNTIPFSEGIGFVADINDEKDDVDYPYYVTAHELGHQWWAHQVIGAQMQGMQMLSEPMAQYSALMVMEKRLGKNAMAKYLKSELNSYLQTRSTESYQENTLERVETQQYVFYNKASVVMYNLKDLMGEQNLNKILSEFIYNVRWKEPPYPRSSDLISAIKENAPDSLQLAISDMFEKITLFDNYIENTTIKEAPNNKYEISMDINVTKKYSDEHGKTTEVTPDEWIDVAIFAKRSIKGKMKDVPIYMKKHHFTKNKTQIIVTIDEKPTEVGIDPFYKLIDFNPYDNKTKKIKTI